MHSEPAIETRAAVRGRRRKSGSGPSGEGPVFVDNSGRRSKALRRIGVLVGVVCFGYAVVLGMAFMGVGISLNPSQLLPFVGGQGAPGGNQGPGGYQPQGGVAPTGTPPTGTPPTGAATGAPPSAAPSATSAAN
ncbi:hypothetical protein [Streptomyces sp. GESEQ-35]|uniref:hypothetical protein n=1 Tax=Streptomyces sp. GESEQ-35 TaxID=2812657 RepID=UPI001B3347C6|nr:hypothetical protein [Streptomyces sp. GESEQ-35]